MELVQRVRIRRRCTYDSSATPTPGQHRLEPSGRAPVDLGLIRHALARAPSLASPSPPDSGGSEELRRRIHELEGQLQESSARVVMERLEVPVLSAERVQELEQATANIMAVATSLVADRRRITAGARAGCTRRPRDAAGTRGQWRTSNDAVH